MINVIPHDAPQSKTGWNNNIHKNQKYVEKIVINRSHLFPNKYHQVSKQKELLHWFECITYFFKSM
jgi:hypothetical protein